MELAAWKRMLKGVREGDEEACFQFWEQYGPMIERVARNQLSTAVQRRVGPESITLSACRTFFRRARQGEFELPDSDALWRLLCVITVNKVRMKARYHQSKKRALSSEVHPEKMPEPKSTCASPEEEVDFAEQLQHIMELFQEDEAKVLELKIQQQDSHTIAEQLDVSERTVRRMLKRIEARLTEMFASQSRTEESE